MLPLLEVRQLRVSFGGKDVVRGIDLTIAPGEKLALVGESGSGKTVTALSLLRLAQNANVSGNAVFQGRSGEVDLLALPEHALRGIRGQDIAMIFQEPMTALNPLFSVGNQIAEVLQLKQGVAQTESFAGAIELLARTGIQEPERRARALPHQLSGGQRQRAMIAMALACSPRLLLADEPTTALDVTVRSQILTLLGELQQKTGLAVLLITHDLNLVKRFADRVAVMEQGRIVETGSVADVFARPQHAYTRKLMDSRPTRDVNEARQHSGNVAPLMSARQLRVAYPVALSGFKGWFKQGEFVAVNETTFTIEPGQTMGVIGESGSGKSTLALACLGLLGFSGDLKAMGQSWGQGSASDKQLRQSVQVVFQDPFSSLSPRLSVEAIVGEGLLVHMPHLNAQQRAERVQLSLAEVGLTDAQFPGLLQRYPHEFSGGQRQRLAIARALIVNPRLLVLDEPTSALDVTVQKQVLMLLQRLQRERGLSYLLITHDVDVIRAMAHDVMVMKDGDVIESGSVEKILNSPRHPYSRILVAST